MNKLGKVLAKAPEANPYSHGFESIYHIETLDIATLRPMAQGACLDIAPDLFVEPDIASVEPNQALFEVDFQERVSSFLFYEPIDILGLSHQLYKWLKDNFKSTLGDIAAEGGSLKELEKLSHGHRDELSRKLSAYLKGRSLRATSRIDIRAWIRSLTLFQGDKKRAYASLEPFGLAEALLLSPLEKAEMRRLSAAQLAELRSAFSLLALQRQELFQQRLEEIKTVFVFPWMKRHDGVAANWQIFEHLEGFCLEAKELALLFGWAETLFGRVSWGVEVDQGIWAIDKQAAESYKAIVQIALSYFYQPMVYYLFNELVLLIQREAARLWLAYEPVFIETVLDLCPQFRFGRCQEKTAIYLA